MKTSLITALMIALLTTVALASPAETELEALIQQTTEAYLKGDTAFLESAIADEATIINSDGTISSKRRDLSELAKKNTHFDSLEMTDVKVRMLGEHHALVTGLSKGAGTYMGEKFDVSTRDVICYEKQGGKWRCIFWQGTEIKSGE
ncbi:MAG TPA: nuclear transport factor 2 family protein [Chthoniobacterales bacterium]|jgi:hypothetical protein